jgi:predicted HD superfamily hydrolase involved in NAD metabolism
VTQRPLPAEAQHEEAEMLTTTTTTSEVRDRIEKEMEPDLLAHVRDTAVLARQLAEIHGVDPEQAELAALIHDIADHYSDGELLILAEQFGIDVSLTEARVPKLLHGPVGAEILRREWGIDDEEILDAIRHHVSGHRFMSRLGKVLFLADKLEPSRDRHYGGLDGIRQLALVDLDAAMLRLYAWRMNELGDAGLPIHEHLVTARNLLFENVRTENFR